MLEDRYTGKNVSGWLNNDSKWHKSWRGYEKLKYAKTALESLNKKKKICTYYYYCNYEYRIVDKEGNIIEI